MLSHFESSFVVRWCQIAVTREWQPRGDVDSTSDAGQDHGESHQRTGFPTDSETLGHAVQRWIWCEHSLNMQTSNLSQIVLLTRTRYLSILSLFLWM